MNTEALETKENLQEVVKTVSDQPKDFSGQKGNNDKGFGNKKKFREDRGNKQDKPKKEYEELLLEVRRVTRVTTGGRRLSFRSTVLVGNRKGKIGIGTSKGPDVTAAVQKASHEAYKNLVKVCITKASTVPYPITLKYKGCSVRLLPALSGTGLKAGSSVRAVLELAGYQNVLSKIMGSNNKLNNAIATVKALSTYKYSGHFEKMLDLKGNDDGSSKKEVKKVEIQDEGEKKEVVVEKKEVKKIEAKKPEVKAPAKKK